MTQSQLQKIIDFCKPVYTKTGRYHAWDHILLVRRNALDLARKEANVNTFVLEAACYLHDIGRIEKDEGHPQISAKMATPFLKKLNLRENEIDIIIEAVSHHDKSMIKNAKSIEAKLLFDADKLEILSVYGFFRCSFWLVEERKMDFQSAIHFLYSYCEDLLNNYLHTTTAKTIGTVQFLDIKRIVTMMDSWSSSPGLPEAFHDTT